LTDIYFDDIVRSEKYKEVALNKAVFVLHKPKPKLKTFPMKTLTSLLALTAIVLSIFPTLTVAQSVPTAGTEPYLTLEIEPAPGIRTVQVGDDPNVTLTTVLARAVNIPAGKTAHLSRIRFRVQYSRTPKHVGQFGKRGESILPGEPLSGIDIPYDKSAEILTFEINASLTQKSARINIANDLPFDEPYLQVWSLEQSDIIDASIDGSPIPITIPPGSKDKPFAVIPRDSVQQRTVYNSYGESSKEIDMVFGVVPGMPYRLETSTDLMHWKSVHSFFSYTFEYVSFGFSSGSARDGNIQFARIVPQLLGNGDSVTIEIEPDDGPTPMF